MRLVTFALVVSLSSLALAEDATPAPAPAAEAPKLIPGERPTEGTDRLKSIGDFYARLDSMAKRLPELTPEFFAADDQYGTKAKKAGYEADALVRDLSAARYTKHPDLDWADRWIAAYRARIAELVAAGKVLREQQNAANAAEKSEVGDRLQELDAFFASGFKPYLEKGYTEESFREWMANLKKWKELGAKGLADMDALVAEHPKYKDDVRVVRLKKWFSTGLEKKLKDGIDRTVHWYDAGYGNIPGAVLADAMQGDAYLERPLAKGDLENEDSVANAIKLLTLAQVGQQLLVTFAKEYEGKPDAALEAKLAQLTEAKTKLEAAAEKVYRTAKLPPAASTSPELTAVVKRLLADKETGAGTVKRFVISEGLTSGKGDRSEVFERGNKLWIRKWTDEYVTFSVASAEKIGSDWRIVYYTFRKYTKALAGDSNYQWYVSSRIPWRRIPEKNIGK